MQVKVFSLVMSVVSVLTSGETINQIVHLFVVLMNQFILYQFFSGSCTSTEELG